MICKCIYFSSRKCIKPRKLLLIGKRYGLYMCYGLYKSAYNKPFFLKRSVALCFFDKKLSIPITLVSATTETNRSTVHYKK